MFFLFYRISFPLEFFGTEIFDPLMCPKTEIGSSKNDFSTACFKALAFVPVNIKFKRQIFRLCLEVVLHETHPQNHSQNSHFLNDLR